MANFEYIKVEAKLEKFRVVALAEIRERLDDLFAEPPTLAISPQARFAFDALALCVGQSIWGENLDTLTLDTPATWWEMFKAEHAPAWFTRRFPVKYVTRRYDMRCVYPKISFPEQEHRLIFVPK